MRASTCKGCGAAIVWIRTPGGKSMPCDATPRYYIEKPRSGSKKIVTPNGEVISCEYTEDPHRPPAPASLPTGGAAGRQAASSRGRNTMDKLTWYDEDGRLYCRRGYEVALARLASYEATELMPDEIVKMGMMFEDSKRYSGRLELKLNAATKRMPKWVSVKERLPEDRSNVLVVAYWHERWGVYMGWCAPERAEWSVHVGIGDRSDVAVVYWMPLPAPPKEDDRND